jgi:hypothetical protein
LYAAANAVKTEARRKRRERAAASERREAIGMRPTAQHPDAPDAGPPAEAVSLLDDALGQLRAKDRDTILLRFFQGKSQREVGQALGVSEAAAGKRTARALQKLRRMLARRGANLPTPAVAATLTAASSANVPAPQLVGNVAAAAIAAAGGAGAAAPVALSATAAAIAKGAAQMMWWTNVKWAAAVGTAVLLVGAAGFTAASRLPLEGRRPVPAEGNLSAAARPAGPGLAAGPAPSPAGAPAPRTTAPATAPATQPSPAREMVRAADEVLRLMQQQEDIGGRALTSDFVAEKVSWSRRRVEAVRESDAPAPEVLAALKDHLKHAKRAHAILESQFQTGGAASRIPDQSAKYFLAEAELWLARAEGKSQKAPDAAGR